MSVAWCVQGDNARTGAEVITLNAVNAPPTVNSVPGPAVGRTYAMAVVLPTGDVAHFGGATTAVEFSDATAVLEAGALSPAPAPAPTLSASTWQHLHRCNASPQVARWRSSPVDMYLWLSAAYHIPLAVCRC